MKSKSTELLFKAIKEGKFDKVKEFDVKATDKDGNTPLHLAVIKGEQEIGLFLLTQGVDVNALDKDGNTPLHLAVRKDDKKIVSALLGRGADVDALDKDGNTPLHLAVRNDNQEIVSALLGRGANVKLKNHYEKTALDLAVNKDYQDFKYKVSRHLVDAPLSPINPPPSDESLSPVDAPPSRVDAPDRSNIIEELMGATLWDGEGGNRNVLHYAAEKGYIDVVRYLLDIESDRYEVNDPDDYKITPLHLAVMNDNKEIVSALLSRGANVNAKDVDGNTPLSLAKNDEMMGILSKKVDLHTAIASYDVPTIIELLDRREGNINEVDAKEMTPLHRAIYYGHYDIASALVKNGADINAVDSYGMTPLHWAARMDDGAPAALLLKNGADINAVDNYGMTPLHFAALESKPAAVQALVSHKDIEINARDFYGNTALQLATEPPIQEMIKQWSLLRKKVKLSPEEVDLLGKEARNSAPLPPPVEVDLFGQPWYEAAAAGNLKLIRSMLDERQPVESKTAAGFTALHMASLKGQVDVVKLLIARGADVNAQAMNGQTPLHRAVEKNHFNVAMWLLHEGAGVNIVDGKGKTPLDLAKDNEMKELFARRASSVLLASSRHQRREWGRFASPVVGAAGGGEVLSPPPVPSKAAAGPEARFKESSIATLSEFNEAKSRVIEELKQNPSNFTAVLVERTMENEPSDNGAGLRIAVVHDLLRDWAHQENPNPKDAQTYLASLRAPNEYNKAFGENEENITDPEKRRLVLMLGGTNTTIENKKGELLRRLNGNDLAYTLSQATSVGEAQVMLNAAIESNMNGSTGEVTGYLPFKIEQALEKCMGDANLAPIEHIMSACQNISLLAPLLQQEPFQRVQKVLGLSKGVIEFLPMADEVPDLIPQTLSTIPHAADPTQRLTYNEHKDIQSNVIIPAVRLVINATSDARQLQTLKNALESEGYIKDHADAFTEKEYDKLGIVRSRSSSVGSSRSSSSTHSSAAGGQWMSEVGSGINETLGAAADNLLGGTVHTATSIAKGLGNILGWREKVTKEKEDSEVKGKGNRGGASRK